MRFASALAVVLWCVVPSPASAAEPVFVPVKIDGPVHDPARHSYWFGPFSECCSRGRLRRRRRPGHRRRPQLVRGARLEEARGLPRRGRDQRPRDRRQQRVRDGRQPRRPAGHRQFRLDVHRGRVLVREPGPEGLKAGAKWKATRIHSAKNMEGVIHGDLDGDGDDDILCNHWAPVPGQGMTWLEHVDRAPWLVEHVIGTEGEYHGNGLGDVNGDGRNDIVTPVGWYEAPARPASEPWTFHADYLVHRVDQPDKRIAASHPILVHDVNGDGRNDIIVGASHEYGLAWLEQKVDAAGKRTFETHWIETDFGQFHTMALGDLNGDGKPDLVTGKRLFAHHGRDTSCYDPLFAFWYDMQGGKCRAARPLVQPPALVSRARRTSTRRPTARSPSA